MIPLGKITIYVIGHSTMSAERFVSILLAHSITMLIDIRTIPKSRHNPQFNEDSLEKTLKKVGIGYVHLKELGGLRIPRTPGGGISAFADTRTTCRRKNSRSDWTG